MIEFYASILMPFFMRVFPPFPNFKRGGLLALCCKRIVARVAAVPSKFIRGFDGQVKGIIIRSIHQNNLRPKDQQLRNFRLAVQIWAQR